MAIRYKVVNLDRSSLISDTLPREMCRIYLKGSIVESYPHSPGIMVFKTRKRAESYIYGFMNHYLILKVKPIGKGKKIKNILVLDRNFSDELQKYEYAYYVNKKYINQHMTEAPYETYDYPAVEVLD